MANPKTKRIREDFVNNPHKRLTEIASDHGISKHKAYALTKGLTRKKVDKTNG